MLPKRQLSWQQEKDYNILVQAAAKEATQLLKIELENTKENEIKKGELEKYMRSKWETWFNFVMNMYINKLSEVELFYDKYEDNKARVNELRERAFMEQQDLDAPDNLPPIEEVF